MSPLSPPFIPRERTNPEPRICVVRHGTHRTRLIKKPVAPYVERVYEYGDFSLLGI